MIVSSKNKPAEKNNANPNPLKNRRKNRESIHNEIEMKAS